MLSTGIRDAGGVVQRFDRETPWTPPGQFIEPEQQRKTTQQKKPAVCCVRCRHQITEYKARMEFDGAHQHVFTNPGGYIYEIALFAVADCIEQGPATLEYTWFSGFEWRLAFCRNCRAHLGWHFSRLGESGFYGLIRSRLVEIDT